MISKQVYNEAHKPNIKNGGVPMNLRTFSLVVFASFATSLATMAESSKGANGDSLTVSVSGKPLFKMSLLPNWNSKLWKKETILIPPSKYPHIQLWCAEGGDSVNKGVSGIVKLIKSEVTNFKVSKTNKLIIAEKPATHLIGAGLEADDGDPSHADIFVFSVAKRVFILCVHGEGDEAAKQRTNVSKMLSTVSPI
jgi:hypothetical protein